MSLSIQCCHDQHEDCWDITQCNCDCHQEWLWIDAEVRKFT